VSPFALDWHTEYSADNVCCRVPILQRTKSIPFHLAGPKTATSHLALIAFLFSLVASYPAWLSYVTTPAGPGGWTDASFASLVSSSVLQLLGLATQILGPLTFPSVFQLRMGNAVKIWIWLLAGFTLFSSLLSVLLYGLVSVAWSGLLAFAGQATMGMLQLLLVFAT
jgi:hypothetical protein